MNIQRVLVTGSRYWVDRCVIFDALANWLNTAVMSDRYPVLVHGGARGADSLADSVWRQWGFPVEVHPADWETYGKSAGHRRNAGMVARGADICPAFPIGESRGTRGCMALAEKAGITVIVHEGVLSPLPLPKASNGL